MTFSENPIVNIIINNYNYGRFLKDAIESSLNQTYSSINVIVVDDGSTDNSREIIAKYSDEITAVLKENGGQGSAYNAGFSVAKGEIIIFLDSDDMLLEDIVQQVVDAFRADTDVAKVQYRLKLVDVEGTPLGRTSPIAHRKMPKGDLRPKIFKFPNYIWPPASGNAFSVNAIKQLFPIPEETYRISADIYVNYLVPFLGSVISLDQPGALQRLHGKNNVGSTNPNPVDVSSFRKTISFTSGLHDKAIEIIGDKASSMKKRDSKLLIAKMVSLKLDPDNHPLKDNVLAVCINGIITALTEPHTKSHQKIFLAIWFIGMTFSSQTSASSLTAALIHPKNRHPLLMKAILMIRKMQSKPA
ncbi:MAG: glycosyltransferase [Cyanobacteria bacterium P01_H01_bin.21]